jgi:DNA-binding transcriptional regulator WhiA
MRNKVINPDKKIQAYIIGLALGDGNLSNPNGRGVRLRISCDSKYPQLLENIRNTISLLLPENKVSLVKRKSNCIDVSSYSNFWPQILGWNSGNGSKFKQNAQIPQWVLDNQEYSIVCLRGLIETDGSIYKDRGYKMVMFVSIIHALASQVNDIITNLGFKPRLYLIHPRTKFKSQPVYHVRLSKNVQNFLELVQPNKS